MSGIAGIIHVDGAPVEPGLIEKMTAAMGHRGPDGIRHWVRGSVALGQCMLCTTPESLEERQPLTNEDESLVLVMDGRVDNWEELRQELLGRGAHLRDRSDAELVLRSYETWGEDCLPRIDGDFAIVIWDARRQTAFCARDRMGHKPFNYHWNGRTLTFASEPHAILALPWVPQIPNEGVLAEFLTAEWHARDETFWVGVLRLVAAHRMTAGRHGCRREEYWQPAQPAELGNRTDKEWVERYAHTLSESVRRLSRSHRPVGYEVSGGLDSSAVFCVADRLRRTGALPAPSIAGFTLAFANDEANEVAYARAVGEHLGRSVHEVPPSRMPLEWYADRAQRTSTFPGYPNATMAVELYAQASARECRVIVNGIGGDEWLGGSRAYYEEELRDHRWLSLLDCLTADSKACGIHQAMTWLARQGIFPRLPAAVQTQVRRLLGRKEGTRSPAMYWLSDEMRQVVECRRIHLAEERKPLGQRAAHRRLLGYLSDAYHHWAAELLESLCAEFCLEVRRPLYTRDFVEFCFASPERLRLRGDRNKYLHVRALQGTVPNSVLERKSKAAFSVVFRRHLDVMADELLKGIPARRSAWLSPGGTARLFQTYPEESKSDQAMWALWGIFGCDSLPRASVQQAVPGSQS